MTDRIRLDGKVALVTGAGGQIGAATIALMAARGARIVAVDRDSEALQRAVASLPASASAVAVTADVTSEDDTRRYVERATALGAIDIFFNNAGIEGRIAPLESYPLDAFRHVLDVNVVGVFLGLKHVLPVMRRQGGGSIINAASIAGLIGSPSIAPYCASKHAVIGLTKSIAQECAGSGIRVNCVCPGLIESRMLFSIFEGRAPGAVAEVADRSAERLPSRRLGLPSEVASVVAFLASDEASYVNGAAYTIDGGRIAA